MNTASILSSTTWSGVPSAGKPCLGAVSPQTAKPSSSRSVLRRVGRCWSWRYNPIISISLCVSGLRTLPPMWSRSARASRRIISVRSTPCCVVCPPSGREAILPPLRATSLKRSSSAILLLRKGCSAMLKAIIYRLYPSKSQQCGLERTLETCRRWYNTCLAERKHVYEQEERTIGKYEQLRQVKTYKATNPHAGPLHSYVLQTVVQDVDKAFQAFFRRVKAGEQPGYPRFKGKDRFKSFGFKEYGNGFKVDRRRLKVAGIGRVAVRWHRQVPGQIKTLRLTRKAGKWYAVLACEVAAEPL